MKVNFDKQHLYFNLLIQNDNCHSEKKNENLIELQNTFSFIPNSFNVTFKIFSFM